MKKYIWLLLIIPLNAISHDYEFKNKYGEVTSYADVDCDQIVIKDKYGKIIGYSNCEYQDCEITGKEND